VNIHRIEECSFLSAVNQTAHGFLKAPFSR